VSSDRSKDMRTIWGIAKELGLDADEGKLLRNVNENANGSRSISLLDSSQRDRLIAKLRDFKSKTVAANKRRRRRPPGCKSYLMATPRQKRYIRSLLANPNVNLRNPRGFLEKELDVPKGDVDRIRLSSEASKVINALKHRISVYSKKAADGAA